MRETVRFVLFGIALCFFGLAPGFCLSANVKCPESAKTGELVTVESDTVGEWIITPIKGVTVARDTGGKILYIVAQSEGEYNIIFIGVQEGKADIGQQSINFKGSGIAPTPSPSPSPSPVLPVKLTEKEKKAAKETVEIVLDQIKDGSIKTATGARSLFKQTLTARGKVCDGYSCELPANLVKLSETWTNECDFTSISTVKKSFEKFLEEVQ